MADTYQAIYDAVRSRISGVNINDAVERVCINSFDISHARNIIQQEICAAAMDIREQWTRPSVLFKPKIYPDGAAWCALYGEDLMMGVCGFGPSPEAACIAFDKAWKEEDAIRARKGGE